MTHHKNKRIKKIMSTVFLHYQRQMFSRKAEIRNSLVKSQSTNDSIGY